MAAEVATVQIDGGRALDLDAKSALGAQSCGLKRHRDVSTFEQTPGPARGRRDSCQRLSQPRKAAVGWPPSTVQRQAPSGFVLGGTRGRAD